MTFLMFARKLSFPNHIWAPWNSQVWSWLLLHGHPIKGHVCFFYLLRPTLNLRGDLVKTLLNGEWLSFSDIEWSCLIAESMKYGILLKSLYRMAVQCMATWSLRINGRTRKFRQYSCMDQVWFWVFHLFVQTSTKKLNELLFSPVDILILECIFLICLYLEINYLQQLLLVDRY